MKMPRSDEDIPDLVHLFLVNSDLILKCRNWNLALPRHRLQFFQRLPVHGEFVSSKRSAGISRKPLEHLWIKMAAISFFYNAERLVPDTPKTVFDTL